MLMFSVLLNYECACFIFVATNILSLSSFYSYFQYGPWWYYPDTEEGVKTWDARPAVFPDGIRYSVSKV